MIGAEGRDHPSALEQRRPDERRDLPRLHRPPMVVAQPRIRLHVVDDDGLAAPERRAHFLTERDARRISGERRDTLGVLAANFVFVAVEFRIADAGDAEVLCEEACGSRLNLSGIAQRPKRVVEPKEKLQALFVRAQLGFGLAVLERRPDTDRRRPAPARSRPLSTRAARGCGSRTTRRTVHPSRAWTDVGANARRLQRFALGRRMRLRRRVVDEQRAAFKDVFGAAAAEVSPLNAAGLRGQPVHVIVDDRAVVALDLAVSDAVDAKVRAEQAACLCENARRIGERPDRVVQFPKERLPIADPAQRFLSARARVGYPHALGGHFDQVDLIACPDARRRAVDAELREPLTFFDQRHLDEGRDLGCEELGTLSVREPWISSKVADDDRLAAPALVGDVLSEACHRTATGRWLHAACMGAPDDELVALDLCVIDAARLEMLTDEADSDVLDLERDPSGGVRRSFSVTQNCHSMDMGLESAFYWFLIDAPPERCRDAAEREPSRRAATARKRS